MKFINRERELNALEKLWKKKEAQLVVIYGKRRIGKTELIKQFIKNKPNIYVLAQRINAVYDLRSLCEAVGEFFIDQILKTTGFPDCKVFFEYTNNRIKDQVVLALNEFPYLTEANRGRSSIFQA